MYSVSHTVPLYRWYLQYLTLALMLARLAGLTNRLNRTARNFLGYLHDGCETRMYDLRLVRLVHLVAPKPRIVLGAA
ncbi:uncharacterized protein F4807DRAFT_442114 [Annulohypoxylon truncatum]|uniref:uncharacterized protein n=1 Tax=Annulohypoxylon truncatum TaxID=327061 RepID=UPI0020073BF6|nr:uncharacterized protein F4807DRAFT_442114 [Annulohypoxylon truncatum]KAI1205741.1 hypothetical protein F4807DRAFT_442114 [Annulohypoxylon truncatum]